MAIALSPAQRFKNRRAAGKLLARRLGQYAGRNDVIVLALPRGGVPVGVAIAEKLGLELDVLLVRKLGFPGHEELAMGAVASGGLRVLQTDLLDVYHVPPELVEAATRDELNEIRRREQCYRGRRPAPLLRGQVVILADDGVATGATMRAAIQVVRRAAPARVVVAVPVCARDASMQLGALVDDWVCLKTPEPFRAVGAWYDNFAQIGDDEVEAMLRAIWRSQRGRNGRSGRNGFAQAQAEGKH